MPGGVPPQKVETEGKTLLHPRLGLPLRFGQTRPAAVRRSRGPPSRGPHDIPPHWRGLAGTNRKAHYRALRVLCQTRPQTQTLWLLVTESRHQLGAGKPAPVLSSVWPDHWP